MNLKDTANPLTLGIFLAITGAIAAFILALSDNVTRDPIIANQKKNTVNALKNVLPQFANNPDENFIVVENADKSGTVKYYGAKDSAGNLVGIAAESVSTRGYAGKVAVIVGFNPDDKVRTVMVTEQNETPGLGTIVCQRKDVVTIKDVFGGKAKDAAAIPPNALLDQFAGHSALPDDKWKTPWTVKKDNGQADYMTGATITSRAVTEAVNTAAVTLVKEKQKILQTIGKK